MNPQFEDSHPNCELNFKTNTSNQYQQNKDDLESMKHEVTETNAQTNTVSGDTVIKSKHDKLTDDFSQNCTNQIKNSDLAQNFKPAHPYSAKMVENSRINDDCHSNIILKNQVHPEKSNKTSPDKPPNDIQQYEPITFQLIEDENLIHENKQEESKQETQNNQADQKPTTSKWVGFISKFTTKKTVQEPQTREMLHHNQKDMSSRAKNLNQQKMRKNKDTDDINEPYQSDRHLIIQRSKSHLIQQDQEGKLSKIAQIQQIQNKFIQLQGFDQQQEMIITQQGDQRRQSKSQQRSQSSDDKISSKNQQEEMKSDNNDFSAHFGGLVADNTRMSKKHPRVETEIDQDTQITKCDQDWQNISSNQEDTKKIDSFRILGNDMKISPTSNHTYSDDSPGVLDIPCLNCFVWEDPLEDRPLTFNIRSFQNVEKNSHTYYIVEVHTKSYHTITSWQFQRRYSEFRNLFQNLKKVAMSSDSQYYAGLRLMLSDNGKSQPNLRSSTASNNVQSLNEISRNNKQLCKTPRNMQGSNGTLIKTSFSQSTGGHQNGLKLQKMANSNNLPTQAQNQQICSSPPNYQGIQFPGRKFFKMNQNLINQRMSELSQFLNDMIDTRKCVYSSKIKFNILTSEEFLTFIDAHGEPQKSIIEFLKDEQQRRISKIVKQSQSYHGLQLSANCDTISNFQLSGDGNNSIKPVTDVRSSMLSDMMGSRVKKSISSSNVVNLSQSVILLDHEDSNSISLVKKQIPMSDKQVRLLYKGKDGQSNVITLLENLNSNQVSNKNEHTKQFFKLYQEQEFRLKTDLRTKLFLGGHSKNPRRDRENRQSVSQRSKSANMRKASMVVNLEAFNELDGIIQLIGKLQQVDSQYKTGMMYSENLLKFLIDMLDYTFSPQAEAFNLLFNNLDIYWVYKMHLPEFIRSNSPYKSQAQKILFQYITRKPIENEEHIQIFFSDDASLKLDPYYQDAYDNFIKYYRSQAISLSALGNNRLMNGYHAPPQNDLMQSELQLSVFRQSIYSQSVANLSKSQMYRRPTLTKDPRMKSLVENLDLYYEPWLEKVKSSNKRFLQSKKELIQLDRFNHRIAEKKAKDVIVGEVQVYKSEFNPQLPLVQICPLKSPRFFTSEVLRDLFSSTRCSLEEADDEQGMPEDEVELLSITSNGSQIPLLVQVKNHETETDGLFALITLCEIDMEKKQPTQNFAIIKLTPCFEENNKTRKNTKGCDLEIIEEAKSESMSRGKLDNILRNNIDDQNDFFMNESAILFEDTPDQRRCSFPSVIMNESKIQNNMELEGDINSKISLILSWEDKTQELLQNFCNNIQACL